jgi:vancomycin resistance protein YoaR
VRALEKKPFRIEAAPLYRYDESLIEKRLKTLHTQISAAPVNAAMRLNDNGGFTVSPAKAGHAPDIPKTEASLRGLLSQNQSGNIELTLQTVKPKYDAAHFEKAQSLLGAFTTAYPGEDSAPRNVNIRLAAASIHNRVVYPGETFSAMAHFGPSTPEHGYERAASIVHGEVVEDYGGGICQVSGTLYNAALYAELEIVARASHSQRVHYLNYGFDAAVAGDYYDLKFKNNTQYPVLITSRVEHDRLVVSIYGFETRERNRHLRFEVRQVELLQPEPYREVVDPNIPRGIRHVTLESQFGYHVELFKHVYVNGERISEEKINTSVYRPLQGVIAIGAG